MENVFTGTMPIDIDINNATGSNNLMMEDDMMMHENIVFHNHENGNGNGNRDGDDDEVMLKAFLEETEREHYTMDLSTEEALISATRQISDSTHETDLASTTQTQTNTNTQTQQSLAEEESALVHTEIPTMTGRPSIQLYLSCNPDHLSEYQCAIRKNVELFEASQADIHSRIKGRNKPIVLGQVGIRCIHCAHVFPVESRERGSMYYPHALVGIYQAAQILSQQHLLESCPYVPQKIREEMKNLKNKKSFATAGKEYWAETARALGVYEDQYGLRFVHRLSMVQYPTHHH